MLVLTRTHEEEPVGRVSWVAGLSKRVPDPGVHHLDSAGLPVQDFLLKKDSRI